MQAYVFTSLAQAQQAVGIVDPIEGPMPLAGTDIGGGMHAPAVQSVTVTYGAIYRNAGGTNWAYVADTVTQTLLPLHMPVPSVQTIDLSAGGNWAGALQVWP
jgi:hypothetical protein